MVCLDDVFYVAAVLFLLKIMEKKIRIIEWNDDKFRDDKFIVFWFICMYPFWVFNITQEKIIYVLDQRIFPQGHIPVALIT